MSFDASLSHPRVIEHVKSLSASYRTKMFSKKTERKLSVHKLLQMFYGFSSSSYFSCTFSKFCEFYDIFCVR